MSDKGFQMSEGKRVVLEPCVAEDIDKIGKYNKDALAVLAKKKFGYTLDRGAPIIQIREELMKKVQVALGAIVEDVNTDEGAKKAIEAVIPRFLLHPINKRVNMATPDLLARGDMIPCTEDGTPTNAPMPKKQDKESAGSALNTNELQRISKDLESQIEKE